MLRYQSRRHQRLMDESEQALTSAAESTSTLESRIAKQVLGNPTTRGLWESRHADLVRPVAKHRKRVPQVLALRSIEAGLLHRRALIDCVREQQIVGAQRDRLFRVFYGPKDPVDAMLAEHRQYILAVASRISADHLIDVMHDLIGEQLLDMYKSAYDEYFELFCFSVMTEDTAVGDAVKQTMQEARKRADALRQRLNSVKPDRRYSNFEREALLAKSGRYPILNYMVG